MIALMFLLAAAVWLVVVIALTVWIPRLLGPGWPRTVARLILFPMLLVLPAADEWIGRRQFKELCEREAVLYLSPNWRGVERAKEIRTQINTNCYITNTQGTKYEYIDINTGVIFFSYSIYNRDKGFIMKRVSWDTPERNFCKPKSLHEIYQEINVDKLLKNGEKND